MKQYLTARFTPSEGAVTNSNGESVSVALLLGEYPPADEHDATDVDMFLGGINGDDTPGQVWFSDDPENVPDDVLSSFDMELDDESGDLIVTVTLRY